MAPRRVILDSDEEDDDFSPGKPLVAPPTHQESNAPENGDLETPRTRRAESTDPSFFRNVYDDHHVAARAHESSSSLVAAVSNELVSTLSPKPPLTLSHINGQPDTSHLSSVTDPVLASRRKQKKSDMNAVVDLTQVTTPGRPTPSVPKDIWDLPSSPEVETGAATSSTGQTASITKKITIKLKKSEAKRKSAPSSSVQLPADSSSVPGQTPSRHVTALSITQAALLSSSEPVLKRRRISSSGEAPPHSGDVDLLVVPRSEDKTLPDKIYTTPTGNSSSIVKNSLEPRSISLQVVPSTTLTASQKDEYRFVSLSSDGDRNNDLLALPAAFGQTDDLHKSSGSATIKYPTPSEYASSGRKNVSLADYGTASSDRPRRRRNAVADDPPSSPDIISEPAAHPSNTRKGMPSTLNVISPDRENPDSAPSSPPARSARRRGKEKAASDELLSPVSAVTELERPNSSRRAKTPSRTRQERGLPAPSPFAANADPGKEAQSMGEISDHGPLAPEVQPTVIQEEPPQKKKRGRKRKEVPTETIVEEPLPDTATANVEAEQVRLEEEVNEEPAPKKRRGRPRKEMQSQAIVIEDDSDGYHPTEEPKAVGMADDDAPKPKKKRGRPRKSDTAKPVETKTQSDVNHGTDAQDNKAVEDAGDQSTEGHEAARKTGKKAGAKPAAAEDDSTRALSERDSNSHLGVSPTKPGISIKDAMDSAAKENQLAGTKTKKDDTKAGATPSQLGKVTYRVGLSRKSRIAPLLKSFRK